MRTKLGRPLLGVVTAISITAAMDAELIEPRFPTSNFRASTRRADRLTDTRCGRVVGVITELIGGGLVSAQ